MQAEPVFAAAVAERRRRGYDGENHSDLSAAFDIHLRALEQAGFSEVGTIWQHGEVRLLCGVVDSPKNVVPGDEPHTHNHAHDDAGTTP